MEFKDIYIQLFSTLFVLRDNTHNLHVNCAGKWSMYYHPFLSEVYTRADWKLDFLMESAKVQWITLPVQYAEIEISSKIVSYNEIEKNVDIQKEMMKEAMDYLMMYLWTRETAVIPFDSVLNTELIDYKKELRMFVFNNNAELGV